jgi:hypothetical protein
MEFQHIRITVKLLILMIAERGMVLQVSIRREGDEIFSEEGASKAGKGLDSGICGESDGDGWSVDWGSWMPMPMGAGQKQE